MNGRISTALKAKDGRSPEEELIQRLGLLDGGQRFSLMLWRIPPGVAFDQVDLRKGPTEYIQCAGGFTTRLTCEIRDGDAQTGAQYVLGRAPADEESQPTEVVRWNGHETKVMPNEVLTGDEVAELFVSYYHRDDVPSSYHRRKIAI